VKRRASTPATLADVNIASQSTETAAQNPQSFVIYDRGAAAVEHVIVISSPEQLRHLAMADRWSMDRMDRSHWYKITIYCTGKEDNPWGIMSGGGGLWPGGYFPYTYTRVRLLWWQHDIHSYIQIGPTKPTFNHHFNVIEKIVTCTPYYLCNCDFAIFNMSQFITQTWCDIQTSS